MSDDLDTQLTIATALANQAELSLLTGARDEAIILGESLLSSLADQHDPLLLRVVARALGVIGATHIASGAYRRAITILDALVTRFQDSLDPPLREQVALALCNKVVALDALGQELQAVAVHQQMVSGFGEEALAVLDQPARYFSSQDEPHVREHLASALYSKTRILRDLGRRPEALLVLTSLIARFQDDDDQNIHLILTDAREDHQQLTDEQSD